MEVACGEQKVASQSRFVWNTPRWLWLDLSLHKGLSGHKSLISGNGIATTYPMLEPKASPTEFVSAKAQPQNHATSLTH